MKVRNRKTLSALVVNPFVSEAQRRACYAADDPAWDCAEWSEATGDKKLPKKKKPVVNARNLLKVDPTRTTTLRRKATQTIRARFAALKGDIVKLVRDEDAFGMRAVRNKRFSFHTDPQKVKEFQRWLKTQVDSRILKESGGDIWQAYAEQGYRKGQGRAFDDVRGSKKASLGSDQRQLDFYAGTKDEFLRSAFGRPVAVEKIQLLAGRSYDDLENVTADMSTRMSRVLVDGLTQGRNPRDIASEMADEADLGSNRAETIARTEIIRAHAEGQLDAMEAMGVDQVGVMVEFSTAADDRVCPECSDYEGTLLDIEEAHGIIPLHPNCRCAFLPYIPESPRTED